MKKTICLITNWFPRKDNPFVGVFFKDQLLAMKDYYNFIVVHYEIGFKKIPCKSPTYLINAYDNIEEYDYKCYISPFFYIFNRLYRFFCPHKNFIDNYLYKRFVDKFSKDIMAQTDCYYCVSSQSEAGFLNALSNFTGKPYIVAEHGVLPWLDSVVSSRNKDGIKNSNLFFAISYDKIRQLLMLGLKLPPYWYVGNMVDTDKFIYKPSCNSIKTLLAVGAAVFYKNYDLLIEIIDKLNKKASQPFKLIIAGYKANEGYAKDYAELEEKIFNSSFSDKVEMIESVPHENMVEIYNKADAFIMTSCQEGQPVSALEAGCCGLPIFATRCGGIEDYMNDDIGRIFGIVDSDAFSDALCDFIEGRIKFDNMNIRNYMKSKFGKDAFVKNMVEGFESVLCKN